MLAEALGEEEEARVLAGEFVRHPLIRHAGQGPAVESANDTMQELEQAGVDVCDNGPCQG